MQKTGSTLESKQPKNSVFPQKIVGIEASNSVDFVEKAFSCLKNSEPMTFLKDAVDAKLLGKLGVGKIITTSNETGWARLHFASSPTRDLAQMAFTSGTEGAPKGIALSHANLADMVNRLNSVMQMDNSIREYVGVPVYHSFGFGRCRAVASVGGEFYIPPNGFNPLELQKMLSEGEVNAISAVPTLWRALFECEGLFGRETHRVKWIEIGSQYMSAQEKLRLKRLFPNACIVQHYGLTEASRATFLQIHDCEDESMLESVGTPVGSTEIKITEEGRIAIRGDLTATHLWRDGEMQPLTDNEGWLVSSDLGELQGGNLYYKGRADDIINCGGVKINPDELERRLRVRCGIEQGVTCCRIPDPLRGDAILLTFRKDLDIERDEIEGAAKAILAEMKINASHSLKSMSVTSFPVTPTGKVKRKELARIYRLQQMPKVNELAPTTGLAASPPVAEVGKREKELMDLWAEVLSVDSVSLHESFLDLGGDSLTAITAIVKMRKLGVSEETCRGILQGKTISEIVRDEGLETVDSKAQPDLSVQSAQGQRNSLNIKFVRGLLVLAVIFAHWSEGLFARLPDAMQPVWKALAPVFSAGTPGFAIMYGVAMGYSLFPLYQKTPERLHSLRKPIAWLLAAGICLLAAIKIMLSHLADGGLTITTIGNSFHGVLTYYLLATLSLTFWFWLLAKSQAPVITALGAAVVLHLFYVQYMMPLTSIPAEGLIELGKLMMSAKYSYFNMTCGVFVGLAIGIALSGDQRFHLKMPAVIALGAIAVISAWWLADISGESASWFVWPAGKVTAPKWLLYSGLCLLLLAGMERALGYYHLMPRPLSMSINLVACFGLLAFPMFVLHELVLPVKEILHLMGLPSAIALAGVLSGFLLVGGYMIFKSYRVQFN